VTSSETQGGPCKIGSHGGGFVGNPGGGEDEHPDGQGIVRTHCTLSSSEPHLLGVQT